jgi:hypothetical protein
MQEKIVYPKRATKKYYYLKKKVFQSSYMSLTVVFLFNNIGEDGQDEKRFKNSCFSQNYLS